MPVIEAKDPSLESLEGFHLWHDDMSSCSQRIRTVLSYKGLDWESHLLSIPKGDNITPEYLAINPNGLVPAFVHDGVLMVESIDIIDYLDQNFAEPALRPSDEGLLDEMQHWMGLAGGAQDDLKVLSHEFIFRAVREISAADVENCEANVNEGHLSEFMRAYHELEHFPTEWIVGSVNHTDACFRALDGALQGGGWLVGDALSLADVAWMPNVHRMEIMDWPMDRTPHLAAWHNRVKALDGYQAGIVEWEPEPLRKILDEFVRTRDADGYHVRNFGALAE